MGSTFTANIISAIASIFHISSSSFKKKNTMLIMQSIGCIIDGIAEIMANSMSAAAQLFVCSIKNFVTTKEKTPKYVYYIFSLFFIIFGLYFNNRGLIGILPIIATVQYTLWNGYSKSAQTTRYGMLINYGIWIVHDLYIQLYVAVIVTVISSIVVIINIIRYRKTNEKTPS